MAIILYALLVLFLFPMVDFDYCFLLFIELGFSVYILSRMLNLVFVSIFDIGESEA